MTRHRQGSRPFIRHNLTIPISLLSGLVCCISVIAATSWLSNQTFYCPDWAIECAVAENARWARDNIGKVQGLMTAVYTIGLTALAYSAHAFSESAAWPLLSQRPFTINQLNEYLAASRGSIPSTPGAIWAAKTTAARLVVGASAVATLLPVLAAPLVGVVFAQNPIPAEYTSLYQPAGGIGRLYGQKNPLTSTAIDGDTLGWYQSWAKNLSQEPMAQYRDWYVDRAVLAARGDMTVNAVRVKKQVQCKGYEVKQLKPIEYDRLRFETNMAAHNGDRERNSSSNVDVRPYPQMAVWADDFVFHSANRTSATVVFAALNGVIEGGVTTDLIASKRNITTASSIICNIDIELLDDILVVGQGNGPVATQTLTSVAGLHVGHPNSTTDPTLNTRNEIALWFAVAPVLCGISVDGKQPMFARQEGDLPLPYTSTNLNGGNKWTMGQIENFIDVAAGAFALSTSPKWWKVRGGPVRVASKIPVQKLHPSNVPLLAILPILALAMFAFLAAWNRRLHSQHRIPVMRLASLGELLKSAQTGYLRERAGVDAEDAYELSRLGELSVRFGLCPENDRAGLGYSVRRFR